MIAMSELNQDDFSLEKRPFKKDAPVEESILSNMTPKLMHLYRCWVAIYLELGRSPTTRELAEQMVITNRRNLFGSIRRLVDLGLLQKRVNQDEKTGRKRRAYYLLAGVELAIRVVDPRVREVWEYGNVGKDPARGAGE